MSDLIDREALLRQIDIDSEGEPGYYGDTWKFIDTIKSMPPAEHSTNLAEAGTDCISRQAAIDALRAMQTYKLFAGDDMLLIDQAGAQTELMLLPPIQPTDKLQKLADKIASFKRHVKSDNSNYLTGYLCALSVVEGMIADMREVNNEDCN